MSLLVYVRVMLMQLAKWLQLYTYIIYTMQLVLHTLVIYSYKNMPFADKLDQIFTKSINTLNHIPIYFIQYMQTNCYKTYYDTAHY